MVNNESNNYNDTKLVIHEVLVLRFTCSYFDDEYDDEYYAETIIHDWQNSEIGKWVIANSVKEPKIIKNFDPRIYEYFFHIKAFFKPKDYLIWKLKYYDN
jgi:hypothetical protein